MKGNENGRKRNENGAVGNKSANLLREVGCPTVTSLASNKHSKQRPTIDSRPRPTISGRGEKRFSSKAADSPLPSETNTDGVSHNFGFPLLSFIDDKADGYLSVGEADELYRWRMPSVSSFF
ncbi:hypothetical protein M9H77_02770 [Catharanthus roseus]|uniref:Uncharacterized protein n=1 Tax=Catharanthus roseus TaxID=4058 RepID=A0ACC0C9I6_CATRO|nr:hypothetical protein M9H77_02770 [Catharanthus roseus]